MQIERRQFGLVDFKADSAEAGTFEGYGAVFGNVDSYGDIIERGAFADSLAEWRAKGKLPPMLLQHGGGFFGGGADDMLPIGQWTSMVEDRKGLKVEGRLFKLDTERGGYIYEGLKSGVLDGLSIGFQTINSRSEVVDEEERRILTELKLWEVSIVTFPANDRALISGVKNFLTPDRLRELEDALGERGISHTNRRIAVSVFKSWLQRDAGAPISTPRDEEVPEEQAALAAAEALAAKFTVAGLRF
jgi:HK97 family phage prohead protease